MLSETGMLDSSPVSTPKNFSTKFHADGEPFSNPTTFRKLIGKLVYLSNTRPDITFVVNHLSQYLSSPTNEHYQAIFRILQYLKGTTRQGIFFDAESDVQLQAYSDFVA